MNLIGSDFSSWEVLELGMTFTSFKTAIFFVSTATGFFTTATFFSTATVAKIDFDMPKWSLIEFGFGNLDWLISPKELK